jgi:hypothetical protein
MARMAMPVTEQGREVSSSSELVTPTTLGLGGDG